jgi:hypothetical protein
MPCVCIATARNSSYRDLLNEVRYGLAREYLEYRRQPGWVFQTRFSLMDLNLGWEGEGKVR